MNCCLEILSPCPLCSDFRLTEKQADNFYFPKLGNTICEEWHHQAILQSCKPITIRKHGGQKQIKALTL